MIRLSTFIWLALAGVVVAGLFHLKYEVQDQERALQRLKRETAAIQIHTQGLYAEWNRLNRPDRLRRMLAARAKLTPVNGLQLREFSELPASLNGDPGGGTLAARPVSLSASPPGGLISNRQ
jgi:hypothetical protein